MFVLVKILTKHSYTILLEMVPIFSDESIKLIKCAVHKVSTQTQIANNLTAHAYIVHTLVYLLIHYKMSNVKYIDKKIENLKEMKLKINKKFNEFYYQ